MLYQYLAAANIDAKSSQYIFRAISRPRPGKPARLRPSDKHLSYTTIKDDIHHLLQAIFDALKKCTVATEQKKLVSEIRLLLQRRFDTQHKRRCLEEARYYVYSMTECRWRDEIKNLSFADVDNGSMVKPFLVRKYGTRAEVVTDEIIIEKLKKRLSPITGDGLFGLIRCDLEVPQADLDTGMWDELAPIFINTTITQDDITDHQRTRLINVSDDPDKPSQFEKRM